MNKELFVSTTPHETKVGITEDDQLAEIYLERENEYTLAGSIYKGRVTRVLPGMQSAFVDIGLERDAFLYVSDFMDLEQQDEDLDEAIPANRPVTEARPRNGHDVALPGLEKADDNEGAANGTDQPQAASPEGVGNGASASRDFRGRRRRRGRRNESGDRLRSDRPEIRSDSPIEAKTETAAEPSTDIHTEPRIEPRNEPRIEPRGDRFSRGDRSGRGRSDSRFQRSSPVAPRTGGDYDYGPPPGYQPIILPGESISKYQKQAQAQPSSQGSISRPDKAPDQPTSASIVGSFPDDEPIFASRSAEPLHEQHDHVAAADSYADGDDHSQNDDLRNDDLKNDDLKSDVRSRVDYEPHAGQPELDREESSARERVKRALMTSETREEAGVISTRELTLNLTREVAHGHVVEEEIEEEEAELTSYGEEPGDDEGFQEVEEETRASDEESHDEVAHREVSHGEQQEHTPSVAAESEAAAVTEAVATSETAPEAILEAEEREADELELEEAQAEAEALLEAEAIGEGTMDASAEVRGPAPEARLLQRTQRSGPERGFDRGRGRRGGRRFRSRENRVVPQISELLKEGQEVLIQIAKEPIGKKGARITSHIALPGRFLVFMPTVNHTGVSRKISSEEERQRLKRIIQSERENGGGGFIVRTAAAGATDEELRADIRFLKNLWNEIKTRSDSSKSPALIYHDLNVVERVLRDQVSSDFSVIWVDTEQEYERIVRFANRFQPGLVKRVKLYTKETPLYDQFGLNEEINKALKSKVWLKSGGYIVINQTEALVAIDVNTGKYVGKTARLEDTIVKTNVDAIKEIVRQVRLRDLGGIIIIDFIDMDERRNRQKVMQALEEALRYDRAPSKVLQFNDFGLVAITRKRVKQSLERTIGTPCPYCQSTGFVKSVNTICNEIYVEMRKISNHLEHSDVMLRVNPEVAKALKLNNAKLLNEMEELTKKTIIVKSDPALHQEQFDIH
jgi:Rne/Rng family ribonuclease